MRKANDFRYERERRRAERRAKQSERVSGGRCQFCGENRPERLNMHHFAGRMNNADATVCVCLNCHATLSDAQQDYSPRLLSHTEPRTRKRRLIATLRGASDCLSLLAERLSELAEELVSCRPMLRQAVNCLSLLAEKLYELADTIEFEGDEDATACQPAEERTERQAS